MIDSKRCHMRESVLDSTFHGKAVDFWLLCIHSRKEPFLGRYFNLQSSFWCMDCFPWKTTKRAIHLLHIYLPWCVDEVYIYSAFINMNLFSRFQETTILWQKKYVFKFSSTPISHSLKCPAVFSDIWQDVNSKHSPRRSGPWSGVHLTKYSRIHILSAVMSWVWEKHGKTNQSHLQFVCYVFFFECDSNLDMVQGLDLFSAAQMFSNNYYTYIRMYIYIYMYTRYVYIILMCVFCYIPQISYAHSIEYHIIYKWY